MPRKTTSPPKVVAVHTSVPSPSSLGRATNKGAPRNTPLRMYSERSQRMVCQFTEGSSSVLKLSFFAREGKCSPSPCAGVRSRTSQLAHPSPLPLSRKGRGDKLPCKGAAPPL